MIKNKNYLLMTATLSAAVGFLAWGHPSVEGVATLFPAIWALSKSRKDATIVALVYYLAGSRVIPESARVFFGEDISLLLGLALWVAGALVHTVPWALLYSATASAKTIGGRAIAAAVLGILPPIAIIGWTSPLLASATLVPGFGLFSIAAGAGIIFCVAAIARKTPSLFVAVAVAVFALNVASDKPLPKPPAGWIGIQTDVGSFPQTPTETMQRRLYIANRAQDEITAGQKVIVFPEQFLGTWEPIAGRLFLETLLKDELQRTDSTVVFGAEISSDTDQSRSNSVLIMGPWGWSRLDARQSVPVAMWRPWSDATVTINWMKSNVLQIGDRRVLFSVCYEDFIPILPIASFIVDTPDLIVSMSNAWWVQGTSEIAAQRQHIESIAKIFGVPLIRSMNGRE